MPNTTPHHPSLLELWVAPPDPTRRATIGDLVVVTRLITVDMDRLGFALAGATAPPMPPAIPLGDAGALVVTEPFRRVDGTRAAWRASGRLYGRGPRLARYTRVELEVSAWSDKASELVLRPVNRSPHHWGLRGLRRYTALAHLAADELERRLRHPLRARVEPLPCAPGDPCNEPLAAA